MQSLDEYYLQDSRSYVGNDVLLWGKDGNGYTTDISKAQVYTQADALARHRSRPTDIPWPKVYLDAKTRPAVDMQYINRNEALQGTGIVLSKEEKAKPERYNCHGCGVFMSIGQFYSGPCVKCNTDNRP